MYRSPKALPPPPHRLVWRWIWVLLIGSTGIATYLLLNWLIRLYDPATALTNNLIAGALMAVLTWASVGGYSRRWAATRVGCLRLLLILGSPGLLLLGLWLWSVVAPPVVKQYSGTLWRLGLFGPPWFGMLLLTYVDVLWPRRFGHRTPYEHPPA